MSTWIEITDPEDISFNGEEIHIYYHQDHYGEKNLSGREVIAVSIPLPMMEELIRNYRSIPDD